MGRVWFDLSDWDSFLSTLLPPTPETLQHVLTQGGIPPWLATAPDSTFDAFLIETRKHVASGSFECVLEACLDRAMDILFQGVEKHVFGSYHDQEDIILSGQEPRERLAAMLPGLARWCHLALEGLPNELVDVRIPFVLRFAIWLNTFCSLRYRGWDRCGKSRRYRQLSIPVTRIAFGNAFALLVAAHMTCGRRPCTPKVEAMTFLRLFVPRTRHH